MRMEQPMILRTITALILLTATPVLADDTERTIQKSPFFEGQYDVYEGDKGTGTVRQNPFHSDELNLYDEKGQSQGTVRKNPFLEDQYDVLDEKGERTETIQKSPFFDGEYDVRDQDGNKRGEVRKDPFNQDQWKLETK